MLEIPLPLADPAIETRQVLGADQGEGTAALIGGQVEIALGAMNGIGDMPALRFIRLEVPGRFAG